MTQQKVELSRGMIIKSVLIFMIVIVVITLGIFQQDIIETITPRLSNFLIKLGVIGESTEGYATVLINLTLFLIVTFGFIMIYFVSSFRATWKFIDRLKRSLLISIILSILGFGLFFSSLVMTEVTDPNGSIIPFLGDLLGGLGTEILGALGLFLLLEVFAKTWEENEEAEYAETKNNLSDTHKQLEALLTRWQQSKLECNNQSKQLSEKSIFNRLLSPQKMPSAYYEGQVHTLDMVIKDIQNLMPEIDTLASEKSDEAT